MLEIAPKSIPTQIATAPYINDIFKEDQTSLMRYVWSRRLENCRKDLLSQSRTGQRVSDIALRGGFDDFSHFSRAFKQSFGHAPRDYRQRNDACGRTSQAR